MPVTDEQIIWLRAYLAGEMELVRRVSAQITGPVAASGLGALVQAAFVITTRRAFAPTWTRADLTRFVAEVRALLAERPDELDPVVAESQLRGALGEQIADRADAKATAPAQLLLLNALVQSAGLDEDQVFELLVEARKQADQILTDATGVAVSLELAPCLCARSP